VDLARAVYEITQNLLYGSIWDNTQNLSPGKICTGGITSPAADFYAP